MVIREVVTNVSQNSTETVDYATYGFLYGTFPTAPTVFLFASQYEIEVDLIATGMVVGTFLSAPLMFVSAKMITLPVTKLSDYDQFIYSSSFDVACVGLGCSVSSDVFCMIDYLKKCPIAVLDYSHIFSKQTK